jgi:hypothetical protein
MPHQHDENTMAQYDSVVEEMSPTSNVQCGDGIYEEDVEDVEPEGDVNVYVHPSYFRNAEAFPKYVRWGIPTYLLATFILLVNADIGSGVSASYYLVEGGEVIEKRDLVNVSILTSVSKLWNTGSYALAIFVALTSVAWPYVKLLLAAYSWMRTYKVPQRQERFVEIIDALGKWSFVDIMVLVEIMVAFRSTIVLAPTVTLEIVITAQCTYSNVIFRGNLSFTTLAL